MDYKKANICYLMLILFKISVVSPQEAPTNSNQGVPSSSLQPRLFGLGAMGFPNFGSGRFGNPTSNYPANPFFPYGNQNNNIPQNQGNFQHRPFQGGYPNHQGYPYQGDSMNPNPNYQRPPYPNRPNDVSEYPDQNRPIQGGYPNGVGYPNQQGYPFQGDSMNPNPNYQRPQYNGPDDAALHQGLNGPYQNGGMPNQNGNFNQPMPGQGNPEQSFQYPSQVGQYPNQGNFQGNPNQIPGQLNPNIRPNDVNNLPDIQFPGNEQPYQNQYYPQTGLPYQTNPGFGQPVQPYPSNYNNDNNIHFPTEPPNVSQPVQFPNTNFSAVFPGTTVTENLSNSQNPPKLLNNQGTNSVNVPNNNNAVAILGKPVIVDPITTSGQVTLDSSTESPTQRKCVQDCPTTSEYDPICGTNNVTYINPGKFICAQNCGEVVYLQRRGRCEGDASSDFTRE